MPIVFIIARDRSLRTLVRAELRERGVQALGLQSGDEAGARIASGILPSAVVLEAGDAVDRGLRSLASRVPFVVVASALGPEIGLQAARQLRRPVRVGEIVAAVLDILQGCSA